MHRSSLLILAATGALTLTACGGGSSEPVDGYIGSWRSACYSYVGNDGNTYFAKDTNNFSKASATSMNVTFTDSVAHADPACNNILGAISNPAGGTVQLGPKASFLGSEVDSISVSFPSGTLVGYMTANATQLFIIAEETNDGFTGWGVGSPYTRIDTRSAPTSPLLKSTGTSEGVTPAKPLAGYAR